MEGLFYAATVTPSLFSPLGTNYANVHDAANADSLSDYNRYHARQRITPTNVWRIERGTLFFSTESIPASATILSVILELNLITLETPTCDIVIVFGDCNRPPVVSDYGALLDDTSSRGSQSTANMTLDAWGASIELNSTGIGEIVKGGSEYWQTKFALRCSRDISNQSSPVESSGIIASSVRFRITYTVEGGHIWIEGTKLHYIDAPGYERAFEGATTGITGTAGHLWVEGTYLHYIDQNGDERRQEGTAEGATGVTSGQLWIEATKLRYIDASGNERYVEGT